MTENLELEKTLWQAADKLRNKTETTKFRNRTNEILFIDARELGTMISRKQKELSDADIAKISDTYHKWRSRGDGSPSPYEDIPGFCKSANIEDIRKNNYILTPGRYIDFKEVAEDTQAFEEKMGSLTLLLKEQMERSKDLDEAIRVNLKKIGYEL